MSMIDLSVDKQVEGVIHREVTPLQRLLQQPFPACLILIPNLLL